MYSVRSLNIFSFFIFAAAVISSLAIGHGDSTLASEGIKNFVALSLYGITIGLLLCVLISYKKEHANYSMALIFPILVYFCLYQFDKSSYVNDSLSFIVAPQFICICLLNSKNRINAVKYFRYYLIFSSICGIVAWISFLTSFPLPHEIVSYYDGRATGFYANYYFAYLTYDTTSISVKLCGLFNEPGYFGTLVALMLAIDRFDFRKKSNIILLIAGLLSWSMAFVITIIFGNFLIRSSNVKKTIIYGGIIYFIFANLSNMHTGIIIIDNFLERFLVIDGALQGNDRATYLFDDLYEKVSNSKDFYLFGLGRGYTAYYETNSSIYKSYIVDYGVTGCILLWGSLLFTTLYISKRNKYALILLFLFALNIYQRPNIYSCAYFLILYGGIEIFLSERKEP